MVVVPCSMKPWQASRTVVPESRRARRDVMLKERRP